MTDIASAVVRRRVDCTFWTPAGDTPYPLTGFNFVPAVQIKRKWVKDMNGPRWVTYDGAEFDIVKMGN